MADGVVNLQVNAIGNFNSVIGEVGKLQSRLQALKLPKNLGTDAAKGLTELEQKFTKFQNLANRGIKTKGDFNNFEKAAKEVDLAVRQVEKSLNSISNKRIKLNISDNDEIKKKVQELERFKKEAADAMNLKSLGTKDATGIFNISKISEIQKLFREGTVGAKNFQSVLNSFKSGNIDQVSTALQKLTNYAKQYEKTLNDSGGNQRGTQLLAWATEAQTAISGADAKIKEFNADIKQMRADQFNKMVSGVDALKAQFTGMSSSIRQTSQEMRNMAKSTMDTQSQLGMLQTQANYFFGLQNMFQLFKRNIQGTFDTVKQLDAAMTETAVVTDYSVSDMWSKLPLYTKTANELGATIKGAYETMTLYYQQGLNTEEAFAVGTETMKMARIAGLDYSQTTDMMTAALRGFNMEINNTSAKRINDVYSELAAVTASDTRELGLAMERTASIAHSANMDFGNTAAFLAQMIETTREAPENLGTAMKTIVARFQELKENPYQISEVDGEEVDFNRVDKALKTIGVDLMDNRDKFRDLDDVFMDISERWDGLSQTQQRYVATIAAGARQQSRFLAMVGNYDRLKELTDAAANSEGAADVQFAKTLDSMEAKINRLKNAWDAFAMGIANNKLLKGAVDFGVDLLSTVNKIENRIEKMAGGFDTFGGSVAKSITSITALWAAFKVGGKLVDTSIGLLGGFLGITKVKGASLFGGISGQRAAAGSAQAAAIYSPIVAAINSAAAKISNTDQGLGQLIKNNKVNDRSFQDFRSAQKGLRFENQEKRIGKNILGRDKYVTTSKQFSGLDAVEQLKGFSEEQQRVLLQQVPGTRSALERSYKEATKKLNLDESSANVVNQLRSQISQEMIRPGGSISPEAGLHLLGDPVQLGKLIGSEELREEVLRNVGKTRAELFKEAKSKGIGQDKTGIERANELKKYVREKEAQLYNPTTQLTKEELRANKFSGITSGATAAGQAVMNLGMALDSIGARNVGSVLTSMGNAMTSIGLAASGAVQTVTALNTALSGIGLSVGPIALAMAGITAAIGVAMYAAKKEKEAVKKIQKDGKKVVQTYDDTIERTTKNINKLTDESATFSALSLGVDSNGNNISLGTEEYSDYLKIVNEVAKMHPELVKGYNAHGQAILKNNNAVEEAIDLEKKQQKQAEAEFTTSASLDKLIASRETTKRWQVGQSQAKILTAGKGAIRINDTSKLQKDSQSVIDNIKKLDNGREILSKLESDFQLSTGALTNLTDEGIKAIQNHGDAMLSTIQGEYAGATDATTKGIVESVQNSIAQVGKDTKGIEKVTEPIYKALSTYASRQGLFENIPEEFREAAEKGIKEISKLSIDEKTGAKITGADMQKKVRETAQEVENLNGHSEEYQQVLTEMDQAQAQFSKDLNKEDYGTAITKNIGELMRWRDQALDIYKKTGQESQKIIAETLQNQIEAYDTFATNGGKSLAEGFNQHSAELEKAAHSYESFQSQTENINDYYTGSDNMKQIIDDIKDGVDDLGKGSQTFWKGAEALLGEDNIRGKSFDEVNKQVGALKDIFYDSSGEARNAEAQADKFFDYLEQRQGDAVKGEGLSGTIADYMKVTDDEFDFNAMANLTADQFKDVANSLGMSETSLISCLNQARQFADIQFSNLDVLREGLATMDGTVAGTSVNKNGEQSLYARRSTFEAEAQAQGYTYNEIDDLAKEIKSKNVKLLADADEMGIKTLQSTVKDMGMKSGQDFIEKFSELGYGKGEIQTLYDKFLGSDKVDAGLKKDIDLGDTSFGEAYNKAMESKDLGLDTDANESTANNTAQIASNTSAILAAVGGLNVEDYDKNETVEGDQGKVYYAGEGYNALHEVYGGTGADTLAQKFASGKNSEGKNFAVGDEQQYQQHYNRLLQMKQDYDSKSAQLEIASQNASSEAEATRFARQANYYQQAANGIDKYIQKGEEAHQELLKQNSEEEESNNSKKDSKIKNDQEEQDSDNKTTQNKTDNNQKKADSTKQLSEEEANAKLQELANKPLEEGESLEDRKQKFLEEADALGVTSERLQALQNQAANFSSLGGLTGSLGDTQKITLFAKGFDDLINSANLTDEQIAQLGTTLNSMSPDQLNNLTKADFGQLLSNLNLTESQIEQLKAANPEIKFKTDTTEVDKVEEKAEEPTKKEHKITYKTEVTPQTNVENKGKQQVQQQTQQQTQQSVTNNTITLNSTIANPNEPKEKIDAAMPKKYTKTVTASITMNASVKAGNLKSQMQKAANSASSGLKVKAATTSTVKTKIDNSAQKQINNIKRSGAVTIKTKADNTAQKAINAIKGKTVTVTISPTFSGNWTKTATINVNTNKTHTGGLITPGGPIYRARGGLASNPMFKREGTDTIPAMLTPGEYVENRDAVKYFGIDFMRRINHKDLQGALQSFGSAARGRGGRLGSNGKGGLTLTGEKGFEVAWIPSENRSMILGANGPQMVDLPSDAVVWNNKQSKKIINRKAIPAGSMLRGGGDRPGSSSNPTKPTKGGTDTKKKGGDDGKGGNDKKSTKKKKKETRELIKQGKISSFIFNLEQQIAQVKIRQEKAQKELNKELERTTATLQSAAKYGKEDLMRLKQLSNLNKKLVSYYNKQLSIKNSDGKASKTLVKWENKTQKRTKKNGKWSKWKDSSAKKHSENINIGRYIKYDKTTGSYIVDYAKINKEIGQDHKNNKTGKTIKGDAAKAKAVKEAAEKAISENTSKRDSAQAAWDDAQDKIAEVGKQLYDTFHGWENELTKIYDLTKKIEDVEKHTSRLKAVQELQEARLASGTRGNTATSDFIENTLKYFRAELTSTTDEFNARKQVIDEQRIEVVRAISSKNELAEYENALRAITVAQNSKNATALAEAQTRRDEAYQKLQATRIAQNYYSVTLGNDGTILNESFDAAKLASDVNAGKISEAQYTAIKEYVEGIREQSQTLNDLLEEQTSSLKDLYDSLGDLKEQYADRAEELLESVENADEENLDKLEKLNDALSDALKDLLDEVKKRLEQRRQQEDNLEKEENISDKQRRLAALRADNSGANAREIKQLEQEIASLQKEYGRTLEDQALDRLQDQADKAAEQRERQIQILNAQLDYAKSTGGNRLRVEALLADPEGNKEEIKELWRQNKKYDEQLSPRKEVLDTEFEQFFADISKNGLQAKIDSTEETIEKTNYILTSIQADVKALMTDLNAPRTSKGQSTGGQDAATMKASGMDVKSTIRALTQKGVTGAALKTQLRKAGFSAKDYKDSGYNAKDAAAYGGFNVKQLKKGGYTAKQLRDSKIGGLKQYKEAGYTAKDLKAAGYSAKALRSQGFNIKQLKAAGYTAEQMRQAGYTAQALRGYGYTQKQIMSAKYTTGELLTAGYSGLQIQSTRKTSTVNIQKAITANSNNPNVTQSDLAGTSAKIDINGNKKGGVKSATVGKSGTAAVTRQGSTLYIQAMKGGKTSGNVGKVPIGSLKTSHFKNYSAQATQALVYAIMHQEPGSKINKDMQALVKKAKLVGRTYKLKNKISGSIDGNGNIHYNNGISGVKVWNTSKGKLIEHKFSKDKKSAFYKNRTNKNVGREYRQVNDARIKENKKRKKGNKLSVYKTGGLADYTGPAWLDGTPSKPELVLNSQDTKNFLALKDVLGKAVGSTQSVTNSNETAMYEININVDHINNDYDVDKIAERIKKDIVKDAGYRNVTQVRHFR